MPVPSPIKMLRDLFSKKHVLNNKKSSSCFDISEPLDTVHNLHIDMQEADLIVTTLKNFDNTIDDSQEFLDRFDKRKSLNSKNPSMLRHKSVEYLTSVSLQEPPITSLVQNKNLNFIKRNSFRKSFRGKNLFGKAKQKEVKFEIGKPFEFKLIRHVEFDKKTKKLIGLPPEWSKILGISYQIKEEAEENTSKQDIIEHEKKSETTNKATNATLNGNQTINSHKLRKFDLENKENLNKFNSIRSQTRSSASIFAMFHNLESNDLLEKFENEPNLAEFKDLIESNSSKNYSYIPNSNVLPSNISPTNNPNDICKKNTKDRNNSNEIIDKSKMINELFGKEAQFKSPKAFFKIIYSATKICTSLKIYTAINRLDDAKFSIKEIDLSETKYPNLLLNEIKTLKTINSNNIVKYVDCFVCDKKLWILMDYLDFGPLTDLVIETILDEAQIAFIARECLKAIDYLHERNIIHRDIKSDNFYLNLNSQIKLVDLGFSVGLTDDLNKRYTIAGTPCWMAPEIVRRLDYNEMVDIWSFGILLIEMIDGEPPYIEYEAIEIIRSIIENGQPNIRNYLNIKFSNELLDFLDSCLQVDPAQRLNTKELLAHDFLITYSNPPYHILEPNIKAVLDLREENYF